MGTLPQVPQQNVFLGLPLELMTEEATLLVEKGAGYIVNDVEAHQTGLQSMLAADKKRYLERREEECMRDAIAHQTYQNQRASAARARWGMRKPTEEIRGSTVSLEEDGDEVENGRVDEGLFSHIPVPSQARAAGKSAEASGQTPPGKDDGSQAVEEQEDDVGLFSHTLIPSQNSSAEPLASSLSAPVPMYRRPSNASSIAASSLSPNSLRFHPTATVSSVPFHIPTPNTVLLPKPNKTAYELYKYMHSQDYFLSPGLRFGCQFMAYPGDPLRFHSHFVCNGLGWDEEINLIDIVTGGRLGTGVKKAWLFGAKPEGEQENGGTRVFTVEWGGF